MGVRLVALDIDGTILERGAKLPSERMRQAVRALQEHGIGVVLASGRMYPGTLEIARALDTTTPLICQQGCAVHRLSGDLLHEFPLNDRIARELAAYARELERPYEWFNPQRYLVSSETNASEQYAALSGVRPEYYPAPEELGVRPTGVGVISDRTTAPTIHRELVRQHGDALHVLDFPDVTVSVAPDANKGHALSLLCADLDVDRHDVLAIGDSVNDAPMLAWAGHGLAMNHADSYAMDAADDVLDGDEEALARFLEQLTPQSL